MIGYTVIKRYRIEDTDFDFCGKTEYESLGTYKTYKEAREVFEEYIHSIMSSYEDIDFKLGEDNTFYEDGGSVVISYNSDFKDTWHFESSEFFEDYEISIVETECYF